MSAAMEHSNVLMRYNVYGTILNVAQLNKVGLKRKNPRIAKRKTLGRAFPVDSPFGSSPPPVSVDEKGEFRVVE